MNFDFFGKADLFEAEAARIEELEAKLAKAVKRNGLL